MEESNLHKKSEIAYALERQYDLGHKDSLQFIAFPLMALGQESKDPFVYAMGNHLLASYLIHKGKFKDAEKYIEKAKIFFNEKEDFLMLSELDCSLANCFYHEAKYEKAIESYKSSIHYGQFSDRESDKINGFFGLGKAYCAIGDTAQGYLKIVEYRDLCFQQGAYVSSATASAFLGEIELNNGDFELAKSHFRESINAVTGHESPGVIASSFNNLGILKFYEGELDSSLFFFRKALSVRLETKRAKGIAESYFNLASYYEGIENIDSAYYYYEKQASFSNQHGMIALELEALVEMNRMKIDYKLIEKFNYAEKIKSIEIQVTDNYRKDSIDLAQKELKFDNPSIQDDRSNNGNIKIFLIFLVALLIVIFIVNLFKRN